MSTAPRSLAPLVTEYLQQRRALGYILRAHERLLGQFARFADATAPGQPITTALVMQWMCAHSTERPRRIEVVRLFARFCALSEPKTEIPPTRLFGPSYVRRAPHIYTPSQLRLVVSRATKLGTKGSPLRPHTYVAYFGLLSVTGMRPGEACRLLRRDLDVAAGTLLVPASKFGKERLLPLHSSTVEALVRYQRVRQRLVPFGEHFFVGPRGQPLTLHGAFHALRFLTEDIGGNGSRPRPRAHDFRHTFATHWIAQWSREAVPLTHYGLLLSAYLGHRNLANTWWYISSDNKALDTAAERFGRYRHGRDPSILCNLTHSPHSSNASSASSCRPSVT